jgi:hypothetical protein
MVLRFRFLNADDVRRLRGEPVEKAFSRSGADTVYIDGDYSKQLSTSYSARRAAVRVKRQLCGTAPFRLLMNAIPDSENPNAVCHTRRHAAR